MDAHIRVVLDRRRPPGVAPEPPAHRRSVFADRLLQLWGWGLLSANMVQFLAEGVVLDDGVCEETRSLAALGGGRRHPGNCRRDLLRRYCSKGDLVKPMPVPMPVQLHSGIQQGEGYVVSPIDMFEYMFSTFPAAFMELLAKNVRKFWDEVNPSDPRLLGHPLLEKGNYREKAVPLVLHGDGAQFARKAQQSLLVCSWRSLLNTAFDFGIFLLFCLPKSIRVKAGGDGPDSARTLWRVVVHLLNALFEGRHPTHDHTGAPWPARSRQAAQAGKDVGAGGFFAVVWNITGDLLFWLKIWAFRTSTAMPLAGCVGATAQTLPSQTSPAQLLGGPASSRTSQGQHKGCLHTLFGIWWVSPAGAPQGISCTLGVWGCSPGSWGQCFGSLCTKALLRARCSKGSTRCLLPSNGGMQPLVSGSVSPTSRWKCSAKRPRLQNCRVRPLKPGICCQFSPPCARNLVAGLTVTAIAWQRCKPSVLSTAPLRKQAAFPAKLKRLLPQMPWRPFVCTTIGLHGTAWTVGCSATTFPSSFMPSGTLPRARAFRTPQALGAMPLKAFWGKL